MSSGSSDDSVKLQVPSSDVVCLIQAYLTEQGLHQSSACLGQETGIGAAAAPASASWESWAKSGQWGLILQQLSKLDRQKSQLDEDLIHFVHQVAILELADQNEWELAYAVFRVVQGEMESTRMGDESRASFLSRKLNELATIRNKDKTAKVPEDFYGPDSLDTIRGQIGSRLKENVPVQPANRLVSLLQHAIKWQSYTGDLPVTRQSEGDETSTKKRKVFDLVRGVSCADPFPVGAQFSVTKLLNEPIVQRLSQKLKFSKNSIVNAAVFFPDGKSLVTGTSDGFIEVYDGPSFKGLKTLPFQMNDECLSIDSSVTALTISRDSLLLAVGSSKGIAHVYNLTDGQCLRQFNAFEEHISSLCFSADSTHLLVGGPTACREFGLRANRMLQDLASPATVSQCLYWREQIVTGCNDGMVRFYRSSDCITVWNPTNAVRGKSILCDASSFSSNTITTSASVLCVKPIRLNGNESSSNALLIVNRSDQACVVGSDGETLAVLSAPSEVTAATLSPSHRLLYLALQQRGVVVFDLHTSEALQKVDVGMEVSAMIHHPIKPAVGLYNSDPSQKRGTLQIWK